jgi:hypothetical protein
MFDSDQNESLTIATRPTMAPVQNPTADHLRSRR